MWRFIKYHCISLYQCCSGLAVETCFWIFQQYFYTWHTLHTFFFACLFFLHILLLHFFQIYSSFLTCFPTFWHFLIFFWLKVSFLSDFTIFSVFPRCDCSHMGHWGTQQVRGHRRKKTEKKTWRKTGWKERQKIISEKQGRKAFPFKTSFQRSRQSGFPFRFSRFPRLLHFSLPRGRGTRVDTRKVRSPSWAVTCTADVFGINL